MKVGIRADGNSTIGMGHLQRCISIADELKLKKIECIFFVSEQAAYATIKKNGIACICLNSIWDNLNLEIAKMKDLILGHGLDCLLIDSYYVTEEYLEKIHGLCKIAYLDDLFQCIYPYDILINYAIHVGMYPYDKHYSTKTRLLLGTRYVPLRKQFKNIKEKVIKREANRVLITTGGTDNYNLAGQLADVLLSDPIYSDFTITIVCGRFNKQIESLEKKSKAYSNLELLCDVQDMASVMIQADVAISASGTTLYELAATGTPFVCFTIADNQLDNAQGIHNKGLGLYAGDVRDGANNLIKSIVMNLNFLVQDEAYRKKISKRLQNKIDGNGAEHIAESIIAEIKSASMR